MFSAFPIYCQQDSMDCGPTGLRMIAKYYGRSYIARKRSTTYLTGEYILHWASQYIFVDKVSSTVFFYGYPFVRFVNGDRPIFCLLYLLLLS